MQQQINFQNFDRYSENFEWHHSIHTLCEIIALQHKILAAKKLHSMEDQILRNTWHAVMYETLRNYAIISNCCLPNLSRFIFHRFGFENISDNDAYSVYLKQTVNHLSSEQTVNPELYQKVPFLLESSKISESKNFYPKYLENLPVKPKFKGNFYTRVDIDALITAKVN